jgi:hypothetical protein
MDDEEHLHSPLKIPHPWIKWIKTGQGSATEGVIDRESDPVMIQGDPRRNPKNDYGEGMEMRWGHGGGGGSGGSNAGNNRGGSERGCIGVILGNGRRRPTTKFLKEFRACPLYRITYTYREESKIGKVNSELIWLTNPKGRLNRPDRTSFPVTSVIAIKIAGQGSSASEVESSHSDSQELLYLYPSDIGTL